MADHYERCAECGNDYERDYMRRDGDRSICSLCWWLRAAEARPRPVREKAGAGMKLRAAARR